MQILHTEETADTMSSPNAGLMLSQRRRRWTNIEPTLGQRLISSGI